MEVIFHKNFKKKFKKLPEKIQSEFLERIDLFLTDKFNRLLNNHSVDKAFPMCRSINVSGDYRAIFYEKEKIVVFILIGTHSELYK